jgi:hypothetical protein
MENNGNREVGSSILMEKSDELLNQELKNNLAFTVDAIDAPKTLWIMRNAILTILDTPNQPYSWKAVHSLITQDDFRADIVDKLKKVTPMFWREEWDSLWKVDEDPLFSKAQQRVARRHSLIVYWTEEWSQIPAKAKNHAAKIAQELV